MGIPLASKSIRREPYGEFGSYHAFWENGVEIGDILMGDDGFYAWWPVRGREGCLTEWFLLAMYQTLQELNKAWQETIDNDPVLGHGKHDME